MIQSLRVLLMSTPVGPLGSGLGGGVELTLQNIALSLRQRGHTLGVIAPQGSLGDVTPIAGALQPTAQHQGRQDPLVLPAHSVLANMWTYARQVQADWDLLLNFAYDWLPFYLTPFFHRPVVHLVSMGSLSEAMDQVIGEVAKTCPDYIAVHTRAQADTFNLPSGYHILGNGLDLDQYVFWAQPGRELAWLGRIAREKGLEDAVWAAERTGIPLHVFGVLQDQKYWEEIQAAYPQAPVRYEGFIPSEELRRRLGDHRALVMTPHWLEAFGNVAMEALACGLPVVAYDRGGPAEIVRPGETGWLVPPEDRQGLVQAITRLDQLDRRACRRQAEAEYSLSALGERLEGWFEAALRATPP